MKAILIGGEAIARRLNVSYSFVNRSTSIIRNLSLKVNTSQTCVTLPYVTLNFLGSVLVEVHLMMK